MDKQTVLLCVDNVVARKLEDGKLDAPIKGAAEALAELRNYNCKFHAYSNVLSKEELTQYLSDNNIEVDEVVEVPAHDFIVTAVGNVETAYETEEWKWLLESIARKADRIQEQEKPASQKEVMHDVMAAYRKACEERKNHKNGIDAVAVEG